MHLGSPYRINFYGRERKEIGLWRQPLTMLQESSGAGETLYYSPESVPALDAKRRKNHGCPDHRKGKIFLQERKSPKRGSQVAAKQLRSWGLHSWGILTVIHSSIIPRAQGFNLVSPEVKPTWKARSPTLCFGKLEIRESGSEVQVCLLGRHHLGGTARMMVTVVLEALDQH